MSKGKSARGVMVDFDLIKIKEQIGATAPPIEVKRRQNFIENRMRRKVAQTKIEVEPTLPTVEENEDDTTKPVNKSISNTESITNTKVVETENTKNESNTDSEEIPTETEESKSPTIKKRKIRRTKKIENENTTTEE